MPLCTCDVSRQSIVREGVKNLYTLQSGKCVWNLGPGSCKMYVLQHVSIVTHTSNKINSFEFDT